MEDTMKACTESISGNESILGKEFSNGLNALEKAFCSKPDLSQLEADLNEWLGTLCNEEGYWDGVFDSDKGMARSFTIDGRYNTQSFLKWMKSKYGESE